MRDVSFGADGSTSMDGVRARYEGELANELGNLASRTIAMINRYRDGALADVAPDPALAADFDGLADQVSGFVDRAEITQALDAIWQRVRRLNRYVEEQAPWQLAKDDGRAADLDRVLRTLAEGLRVVTILLWPWLPESAEKLLAALGAPERSLRAAVLDGGRVERVTALEPLFPKPT
jgi:methionyl-tRNA synthetase